LRQERKKGVDYTANSSELRVSTPIQNHAMTAEEQAVLNPEMVLQDFKDGNERFRNNNLTVRDHKEQVRKSAPGQYPKAIVLSCVDSRVTVEDIFDQGIGDLFVGRIAGNFINIDLLGSMEFACKVAGAKLIMVLAHQHCGAIKAAIDDVKMGKITAMFEKIKPAVAMSQNFTGEKTTINEVFVKNVTENNVRNTMKKIRKQSPILKEMEAKGEIKIVGVLYTLTKDEIIYIE
jgi:carbonic anhydrase